MTISVLEQQENEMQVSVAGKRNCGEYAAPAGKLGSVIQII
jgi:hypothetical protein